MRNDAAMPDGPVLAYRALYCLVPLAGGLVIYLLLERYAAGIPRRTAPRPVAAAASGVG